MPTPTRLVLLAAGLLAGAALLAQSAPKPATTPAQPEDVLELSPFMVKESNDEGWNAASTLLGSRINQDLVKVPVTVDVLTKDFLNDIGVFNMDDAAAFVSGVTVTPRLESRNDNGRITFRGLAGGSNTSRNFFQWSVPSDTYNVERFDFGKGSNSLMFGDSTPGGQVTTTTKRARFANTNELLMFYDSLDSYRAQLDLNRKITSNFAVRLNVVNRTDNAYVHGSFQTFRAGDIAFTYRPFPNTIITLEGERGQYIRRRADNTAAILPVAAPGRGRGLWFRDVCEDEGAGGRRRGGEGGESGVGPRGEEDEGVETERKSCFATL
jgi:outer membrane receptor protein involved in Fe transport